MEFLDTKKKGVITIYEPKELYSLFEKYDMNKKLSSSCNKKLTIIPDSIQILKSTRRSSIYQLQVQTTSTTYPIIFKIYNAKNYKNEIEINMYKRTFPLLHQFLPTIYLIEESIKDNETWIFMEFVNQIRGQLTFTPKHFDYIIPAVAALHAKTFEDNFQKERKIFQHWLPHYRSEKMKKEQKKYISNTVNYLDKSIRDKELYGLIKPHYHSLQKIYEGGPDFFPELTASGSAITHGDLHMQNICSKDVSKNKPWDIQFIDWESAKFSPTWFDMIVLVEILIGFRKDWQHRGEEIRTHCVNVYANEMKKHGISFRTDPFKLYKMAYMQRTLEKGLHTQLRRIYDGRKGELLSYHLKMIEAWGKELGIYK